MPSPIVPPPAQPTSSPKRGLSQGWIAAITVGALVVLGAGYLLLGGTWPPSRGDNADVNVESCTVTSSGLGVADLVVQNTSGRTRTYAITVVFETGGTQVGSGIATVLDLQPGQVARDRATGRVSLTNFTCRVSSITG